MSLSFGFSVCVRLCHSLVSPLVSVFVRLCHCESFSFSVCEAVSL